MSAVKIISKPNPYITGYRGAYSHASASHAGYCYILAVTIEYMDGKRLRNKAFIAGLQDGAFMGARDRARRK